MQEQSPPTPTELLQFDSPPACKTRRVVSEQAMTDAKYPMGKCKISSGSSLPRNGGPTQGDTTPGEVAALLVLVSVSGMRRGRDAQCLCQGWQEVGARTRKSEERRGKATRH